MLWRLNQAYRRIIEKAGKTFKKSLQDAEVGIYTYNILSRPMRNGPMQICRFCSNKFRRRATQILNAFVVTHHSQPVAATVIANPAQRDLWEYMVIFDWSTPADRIANCDLYTSQV